MSSFDIVHPSNIRMLIDPSICRSYSVQKVILICHIISPRYYVDNRHFCALRNETMKKIELSYICLTSVLQSLETHMNVELTAAASFDEIFNGD